jgi:hypothetical protein
VDHCTGKGRTENEGNDRGPGGSGWCTLGLPGAQEDRAGGRGGGAAEDGAGDGQRRDALDLLGEAARPRDPRGPGHPGQLGGDAIVDILFGRNNPVTWYPEAIAARRMHDITKSLQGWPKLWASFKDLIWIFSQSVGLSLAIWANLVQFSFMKLPSSDGLTHLYCSEFWPFGSHDLVQLRVVGRDRDSTIDAAAPVTTAGLAATAEVADHGPVGHECAVAGDAVVLGFANSTGPQLDRPAREALRLRAHLPRARRVQRPCC